MVPAYSATGDQCSASNGQTSTQMPQYMHSEKSIAKRSSTATVRGLRCVSSAGRVSVWPSISMHQSGHSRTHSMQTVQLSSRSAMTPRVRGGRPAATCSAPFTGPPPSPPRASRPGHRAAACGAATDRRSPRGPCARATGAPHGRPARSPCAAARRRSPAGSSSGSSRSLPTNTDAEHLVSLPLVPRGTAVDHGRGRQRGVVPGHAGPQQQMVVRVRRGDVRHHREAVVAQVVRRQQVEERGSGGVRRAERVDPSPARHVDGDRAEPVGHGRVRLGEPADDRLRQPAHGRPTSSRASPSSSDSGRGGQPGT